MSLTLIPLRNPRLISKAVSSTFHLVSNGNLTLNTSHNELLTCALKPALCQVFSISENGSSFPPIAQAKNFRITFNSSLSFIPHIQSISKTDHLRLWSHPDSNHFSLYLLLSSCSRWPSFNLDYCNSLQTVHPAFALILPLPPHHSNVFSTQGYFLNVCLIMLVLYSNPPVVSILSQSS